MEIKNAILKGMVQDVDPRQQPEGTWRDSRNGTITQYGNMYVWKPIWGTRKAMTLPQGEQLMNYCNIRDRYFALALNDYSADPADHTVKIYELIATNDYPLEEEGTELQRLPYWSGDNVELNLSHEHPVRIMFGVYENEEIQRIYWSDDWQQPRVINVGPGGQGMITLEEKFVNFVPVLENAYGTFEMNSIISGGSLRAGSYFFCWRFYTGDGYYTDWSYLSNPVPLTGGNHSQATFDGYQNLQGMAPDENTSKAIRIYLSDLDQDYPSIQIAAFYSNAYNSAEPGIIFYDGSLSSTEITVEYRGNENLGTVTMEELVTTSITVVKIKDMATIKNRNIIANIKERDELDVSGMNTENKNDRMEVSIDIDYQEVPLDYMTTNNPVSPTIKAAWAAPHSSKVYGIGTGTIFGGMWYQVLIECTWQEYGSGPTHSAIPVGSKFFAPDRGAISVGSAVPMIRVKKYRKAGAVAPYSNGDYIAQTDDDDDYVWDEKILPSSHYLDWKNPYIANKLRGYPGGEVIRFGALFFDLSGRPFFARWLKNTDITWGQGDITTPKRGNNTATHRHTVGYSLDTSDPDGDVCAQINARTMGVIISDLDITDIKDQISGFMIVRAPIIHQYLATGALVMCYEDVNDVYQSAGFTKKVNDDTRKEGTYAFWCPEELFGMEGFAIQPGDELENVDLFWPYLEETAEWTNWDGMGVEDVVSSEHNYVTYQKFMLGLVNGSGNSLAGVAHEILHHIPFRMSDHEATGDDFDEYDPDDPTLTYKETTATHGAAGSIYGKLNDHSIVILDIDESGNDPKIPYQIPYANPRLQLCSVKRENNTPYGSTGESSLANTIYKSIGHFQIIDATVLSEIESNGKYVFNEIEIFGGDIYIQLFDVQRTFKWYDAENDDAFAHAISFPVESRMLIGYREGEHHAKTRYHDATNNPQGLRYAIGTGIKTEDFNYNDGYSSDHIGDFFLPLPFNFSLQSEYSIRFRYTNQKVYSELQDSYRYFPAGNLLDVDSAYGEVNNIKAKFGKIVYWQDDAVGYIPILERQLSQTEVGNPVQIGIGGVFERFDELIETIGNQHQFGMVESDIGFHWIDSRRRVHVTLTNNLKIDEGSITKGIDIWMREKIPQNFDNYDRPGYDHGIVGGYDRKNRRVYHTITLPGENISDAEAICYDVKLNAFIGYFDFPVYQYLSVDDFLYGMVNTQESYRRYAHLHLDSNIEGHNQIYLYNRNSHIELIVKDDSMDPKIWDTMVASSSENFANNIYFEAGEEPDQDLVSEESTTWINDVVSPANRNYRFRNKKWYFNVPRLDRKRLLSDYLKVKFEWDHSTHRNTEVELRDLRTNYRKAY